jgi:hypothetical protein
MRAKTKRRMAALARMQAADDARQLALELATGRPQRDLDTMALGLITEPGETAFRYVEALLSQYDPSIQSWQWPQRVQLLLTDRRAMVRQSHGVVISLWWEGLVAVEIDIGGRRVVLDYGDAWPRTLSGPASPSIAVTVVTGVFGVEGLLRHPALAPIRACTTVGTLQRSKASSRTRHAVR